MKNVIKRCVSLLTLFNDKSTQISTEYIRDNISSYRDLSDSAFKRSFERDKVLLREMGYSLDYVNCLLYTSPSPRDVEESRMPSSA